MMIRSTTVASQQNLSNFVGKPLLTLSLFLCLVSVCVYFKERSNKGKADIVIGILSGRENFDLRKAQRDTWLKCNDNANLRRNKRIIYKFIIGSKGCDIHDEDRKNKYSCESDPLIIAYHGDEILAYNIKDDNVIQKIKEPLGLDFEVQHPIVIKKLALISTSKSQEFPGIFKVAIFDRISKQEIVSADFHSNITKVKGEKFYFQSVDHIVLPKDFKGSLVVDIFNEELSVIKTSGVCLINDGGGLISFQKVTRHSVLPRIFPDDLIHRDNFCHFLAGSFIYSALDEEYYQNAAKRVKERRLRHKLQQKKLAKQAVLLDEEMNKYGDIKFVDLVDHYQNLPKKILQFYKWVVDDYDFNFTIKTDDDCFLNIPGILKEIDENKLKATDKIWFSNFRFNWPLDKFGKWAEHTYTSPLYPAFACGSGNLLSRSLVEWIARNVQYLHTYQGEDVSVGIWLSAVAPKLLNDRRWSCIKSCRKDILSYPDNSPSELKSLYNNTNLCGNPCSCS